MDKQEPGDGFEDMLQRHARWLAGDAGGRRARAVRQDWRQWEIADVDLRRALLCHTDLRGASLWDCNMAGCDLSYASLGGARLCRVDLTGAALCRARMTAAVLEDVQLPGADLRGSRWYSAHLKGVNLAATRLQGAVFVNVGWDDVDFSETGCEFFAEGIMQALVTPEHIGINCQWRPHSFWRAATKTQIDEITVTHWIRGDGWGAWQRWKETLLAAADACALAGWPRASGEG